MKTACPDEEMLVDYIEGRLSDVDRADIEAHLSRYVQDMRRAWRSLSSLIILYDTMNSMIIKQSHPRLPRPLCA
jgi:hypothetical protein